MGAQLLAPLLASELPEVDLTTWSGIFDAMPQEEYHRRALGIASAGGLKLVRRSLAHYRHWSRTPFTRTSKALEFGKAYHAYVLEPEAFDREYVVPPLNAPKRPSERERNALRPSCKTIERIEYWEDFEARHAGKIVVPRADYQKIQDMRGALDDVDMVGELPSAILTEGRREVSYRWVDPDTGLPCRSRFDYVHDGLRYGLDLKSCANGMADAFTRSILQHDYHISQAHYLSGAHALGRPLRSYLFLAQETEPPYVAAVTELGDSFETLAFEEWRAAMTKLAGAVRTGKFPGYTTGIRRLEAPAYAFYREESTQ